MQLVECGLHQLVISFLLLYLKLIVSSYVLSERLLRMGRSWCLIMVLLTSLPLMLMCRALLGIGRRGVLLLNGKRVSDLLILPLEHFPTMKRFSPSFSVIFLFFNLIHCPLRIVNSHCSVSMSFYFRLLNHLLLHQHIKFLEILQY